MTVVWVNKLPRKLSAYIRGVICCDYSYIFMPAFWIQKALNISMDIIYSVKILAILWAKGLFSTFVWAMSKRGTYCT